MNEKSNYTKETKVVPFGNGTIRINNLTPVLTEKERKHRKREAEKGLFRVFVKYANEE